LSTGRECWCDDDDVIENCGHGLPPSESRFSGLVPRADRETKTSRWQHEVRCNRLVGRQLLFVERRFRTSNMSCLFVSPDVGFLTSVFFSSSSTARTATGSRVVPVDEKLPLP
jgi:hypothetical protein